MAQNSFFIDSDNLIKLVGLKDASSDSYINDATVTMSLFEEAPLNITYGAAVSEVQTIQPDAPATDGTFTLTYEGQTTGAIPYNSDVEVIQDYLELLTTVAAGDITVSGDTFDTDPVAGGMIFTFADTLGNVNALSMAVGSLTGVTSVTVVETTKGVLEGAGIAEVQSIIPNSHGTAGHYHLTYKDQTTGELAHNASVGDVKTALELLSTVAAEDIVASGDTFDTNPPVNGMIFTFAITLGNVPMLSIDVSGLTGVTSTVDKQLTHGRLENVAIDETGGEVGIPVEDHDKVAGESVRFVGTAHYDGEYEIQSVEEDKIVITESYVAETFTGEEEVFLGVVNGQVISLSYVSASDGDYEGVLPDTLENIYHESWYQLFWSQLVRVVRKYWSGKPVTMNAIKPYPAT